MSKEQEWLGLREECQDSGLKKKQQKTVRGRELKAGEKHIWRENQSLYDLAGSLWCVCTSCQRRRGTLLDTKTLIVRHPLGRSVAPLWSTNALLRACLSMFASVFTKEFRKLTWKWTPELDYLDLLSPAIPTNQPQRTDFNNVSFFMFQIINTFFKVNSNFFIRKKCIEQETSRARYS